MTRIRPGQLAARLDGILKAFELFEERTLALLKLLVCKRCFRGKAPHGFKACVQIKRFRPGGLVVYADLPPRVKIIPDAQEELREPRR